MTEEQYWDKDCELARYYRKAAELKAERLNQQAWLQGLYIYDAIARISPIMNPFAKSGTQAQPYVSEPYPISKKSAKAAQEQKEKDNSQKWRAYMESYMAENNKRFSKEVS